jgi:L-rhamnose-H+ transport protein
MGRFDFSSWTLHMASIMIFGTLVGVWLSEWKGVSRRTRRLMVSGLAILVSSTVVIGYGNLLNKPIAAPTTSERAKPQPQASSAPTVKSAL